MKLIEEYRRCDFNVLGVLGIDGSPSCGVELYYFGGEKPGAGAFVEELKPLLAKISPSVPIKGIQDAKIEEALALIEKWDKI